MFKKIVILKIKILNKMEHEIKIGIVDNDPTADKINKNQPYPIGLYSICGGNRVRRCLANA